MKTVKVVTLAVILASATAHAASYEAQALQILQLVDGATEFENSDPNASLINQDTRFLKNEYRMLLGGALGEDIAGWGKITVEKARCAGTSGLLKCTVVLESAREIDTYAFEAPAISGTQQIQKVTVTQAGPPAIDESTSATRSGRPGT